MNTIETQTHTIHILIAPSGSGKTYFTENHLIPKLRANYKRPVNIQHISSDNIRRELLGNSSLGKYDDVMLYASEQAFDLLYAKLRALTRYPINAEHIIIDTIGLSKEFRDKILNIAKDNHYNVDAIMFSYRDKDEYTRYLEDYSKKVVFAHIKKFHQTTIKEINKRDFVNINRIKSKDFEEYEIIVKDAAEYDSRFLPLEYKYVVIGDIHGCIEEFKEILIKQEFQIGPDDFIVPSNNKIILVGDYIDKGKNSKKVVDFIYKNINEFYLIKGNHENFTYKSLKGLLKENVLPEEFQAKFFSCKNEFKDDEDIKQKFFTLVERSKEFLIHPNFIVTHALCKRKYLGKIDARSLQKQRKSMSVKMKEGSTLEDSVKKYESEMSFIKDEAVYNHPFHFFGHDAFKDILKYKNKIGLDTGCSDGNKLSSVAFNGKESLYFASVKSKQENKAELILPFQNRETEIDFDSLDDDEQRKIKRVIENKINFISGTMCPAEQDIAKNDLESMEKVLQYYRERGVKQVILQPKYMGSRCEIYLNRENDE